MVVLVVFTMAHGEVAPTIVVVPGVIEVALPPTDDMTPELMVMVVPSGLTQPNCDVVEVVHEMTPLELVIVDPSDSTIPNCEALAFCTAGAASDLMKVVAEPLTAVGPAVPVGLAPVAVLTAVPPTSRPVQFQFVVPVATVQTDVPPSFKTVRS